MRAPRRPSLPPPPRPARWLSGCAALALVGCPVAPRSPDAGATDDPAARAERSGPLAPDDGAPATHAAQRPAPDRVTAAVPPPSAGARLEDEQNTIAVFEAAAPATVFVTQKRKVRDFWSRRALEVPAGTGSGFLWDNQGHVVTNAHVVAGGEAFEVTDHKKRTYPAEIVGGDVQHDIAVLEIKPPAEGLAAIRLPAEGYALSVGQKTLAIGNPFGLDQTLTVGVISALGREIPGFGGVTIRGMVQTDASINPGNSGGPLLNSAGELIGMNTLIFSKSGSSAGIGFAVPVSTIRRLVDEIIKYGAPVRAGLGITLATDDDARANRLRGVVVEKVLPDSPAEKAGLRGLQTTARGTFVGDVIVGADGEAVEQYDDLYQVLDQKRPGDAVRLTVERDGKKRDVEVTLIELKRSPP